MIIIIYINSNIIRFCHRKKLELGIKIEIMYLIIILMTLFHWLMSLVWFIFKKIDTKKSYTADQREFLRCDYPISKNIRYKIV